MVIPTSCRALNSPGSPITRRCSPELPAEKLCGRQGAGVKVALVHIKAHLPELLLQLSGGFPLALVRNKNFLFSR